MKKIKLLKNKFPFFTDSEVMELLFSELVEYKQGETIIEIGQPVPNDLFYILEGLARWRSRTYDCVLERHD